MSSQRLRAMIHCIFCVYRCPTAAVRSLPVTLIAAYRLCHEG